ncbi:MAG: type IV secretory system conjugative DNA transfer family protein [Anaerolineae bacterium]
MPQLLEAGHELISGSIGMGKSYWVLYKIIMSLVYGYPCCYIDPKGEMYLTLLAFLAMTSQGQELWETLKHRIIFLNPITTSQWMVGFNAIAPLDGFPHANPDLIALLSNALVSHIRRQSGFEMAEANRMQQVMSAAIGILVEGGKGQYTLAELPQLFVPSYRSKGERSELEIHNRFVQSLLPPVTHPGTLTFWQDQWPTWTPSARREWVQSTEGRIFQYLFDERVLLTLCTAQNGVLDFTKLVDEGYWLFVHLPYALMSDTVTSLLGNLITSRILYACMQRPLKSRPYRLILDEARFFNTGPLDTIMETSRAYNLWLTLVVQSIDQLCRSREGRMDERLKETVLNLCRYFSIFQNSQDGETMARLMFPLTGQVATGIKASGDWEYQPIMAEQDEHVRRFMNLRHREMVFYDKMSTQPPQVWRTPDVLMDPPDEQIVRVFEDKHLRRSGKPVADIRDEIAHRQEQIRAMLAVRPAAGTPPEPRRHGKPSFSEPVT